MLQLNWKERCVFKILLPKCELEMICMPVVFLLFVFVFALFVCLFVCVCGWSWSYWLPWQPSVERGVVCQRSRASALLRAASNETLARRTANACVSCTRRLEVLRSVRLCVLISCPTIVHHMLRKSHQPPPCHPDSSFFAIINLFDSSFDNSANYLCIPMDERCTRIL